MRKYWVVMVVLAALAGGIIYMLRDNAADSKRQTAEAPVIGFVATPTRWWDGEDNEEGHTLTFSFVDAANGVHAHTMEQVTWYDPAKTYKVCYNPRDPKDWELYSADHACGS